MDVVSSVDAPRLARSYEKMGCEMGGGKGGRIVKSRGGAGTDGLGGILGIGIGDNKGTYVQRMQDKIGVDVLHPP